MIPQLSFYQYRPIYQGAPLEEAQQAFAIGAQAYDTNLENFNKLEAFGASLRSLPQDQEYLKQKLAGTQDAIKSIADQTTGSKRWDLAGDALQRMKSSFQGDEKLGAIRESYLNFQKGEEIKQQMRAAGKTPFELTDINNHKSFDDQGNINIYRPDIRPKADYVAEATDIWKNIAPDIFEAQLQPSEVEGILSGKTIRGISPEKLRNQLQNVRQTYMETDSGQQHKQFIQKNSPEKDPDKFINDFLFGVGSLRAFREERTERVPDESYKWAQRTEHDMAILAAKNAIKKGRGSSEYDPDAEGLLGVGTLKAIDSGIKDPKTGLNKKTKSNALFIQNKEIVGDLSDVFWTGDGSRVVPLNKNENFHFEDTAIWGNNKDTIKDVKIKGFAMDEQHGQGTLGGAVAELSYLDNDGKDKKMEVIIKNNDENFTNLFTTQQSLSNIIKKHNKSGYEGAGKSTIVDTSGLLGSPGNFGFWINKDNEVRPVVKRTDGTWRIVRENEFDSLNLKEKYSTSDIQALTANKVAQNLKSYTKTNKDIQNSN